MVGNDVKERQFYRHWLIVALDMFYHEKDSYLLTVIYCGDFFEINLM